MNIRGRVIEALLLLIAVAVVARVVFGLLSPLLAPFIVLAMLGSLLLWIIRGPHASR